MKTILCFLLSVFCFTAIAQTQCPWAGASVGVRDWKTSLVGYWPLDSLNQGRALDWSGNGNVCSVVSNVVLSSGIVSGASRLNTNNYMALPNDFQTNFSTGKFTVATWIMVFTTNGVDGGTILKNWGDTITGSIHFDVSSGVPRLFVCQSSGATIGPVTQTSIATNVWYHVAAVADGSNIKIFLNGISGSNAVYNGTLKTSFQYSKIGVKSSDSGGPSPSNPGWLNGAIDDFRIYNRALTTNEIQAIYRWGWRAYQ